MRKLLSANFYELLRSRFFYITMAVCVALGAGMSVLMYCYPELNLPDNAGVTFDKSNVLSLTPNFAVLIIPFAAASTVAFLLDSQYNQGTIRNKLISGHTRTTVFLSNLITACIPTVIYFVLFEAASMGTAVLVFGYENYELKASLTSLSVMLISLVSISAVLSFVIGNMLRGGKMIVIILVIQYALNASLIVGFFKADNKVLDLISRAFPQGCFLEYSYSAVPEKMGTNVIISAAVIIVLTVFGAVSFKKCDIK